MSFPRYPAYKDSGVEWLGVIPEHWFVMPLARIASGPGSLFIDGDWVESKDLADEGIRYITTGNVGEGRYKEQGSGYISQEKFDELRCNEVLPGDVLISRLNLPIGRACVVPDLGERIITSVDNVITRPDDEYSRTYLAYMLSSASHFANMEVLARGTTMQRISRSALGQVRFAFPSLDEQESIALFLDRETAKIDALVAEQEQLIALLKEKRQAVISHAVTKGLDPSAPMKDSGVEWLGKIPISWERVQLGRLCKQVSDGPHFSPSYVDDGVLFLSARNIGVETWHLDDAKFISEADYEEFCRRVVPEIGDVLYTKGGTTGVARVVDLKDRFQIWVHVAVLKLHSEITDPYFLAFALNSIGCYEQSQIHTRGATNQDLGLTRMIRIWLALPPLHEQRVVATHLKAETARLDQLVEQARQAVALLQERRAALISAAVTGQIDVRGLAAAQAHTA